MTCISRVKPTFKGVVISTPQPQQVIAILMCCSLLFIKSSFTLAVQQIHPFCVYLEGSQELDCKCPDIKFQGMGNNTSGSGIEYHHHTEPSDLSTLIEQSVTSVHDRGDEKATIASIHIHDCRQLDLRLDLTSLQRPFYRLRIEDTPIVRIEGVRLLSNDTVDVWFRNIGESLSISGAVDSEPRDSQIPRPNLTLHIVDVNRVALTDVVIGAKESTGVNAKVQIRNADSLLVRDSFFKYLAKDSIEIFHVENVTIDHCELHNSSSSSILVNMARNITISESLMKRENLETLSKDDTQVRWVCTLAPEESPDEVLSPEERLGCSSMFGARLVGDRADSSDSDSAFTGAIVLATCSSLVLIMAVAALAYLQRTGKLEHCI